MKRTVFFLLGCFVLLSFMAPTQAAKRGLGKKVVAATPFVNGAYRALLIGNNAYKVSNTIGLLEAAECSDPGRGSTPGILRSWVTKVLYRAFARACVCSPHWLP